MTIKISTITKEGKSMKLGLIFGSAEKICAPLNNTYVTIGGSV